jgi:hypothetical protein
VWEPGLGKNKNQIVFGMCGSAAYIVKRFFPAVLLPGLLHCARPDTAPQIDRAEEAIQLPSRPVPANPNARAKCFVFDGRQFCE